MLPNTTTSHPTPTSHNTTEPSMEPTPSQAHMPRTALPSIRLSTARPTPVAAHRVRPITYPSANRDRSLRDQNISEFASVGFNGPRSKVERDTSCLKQFR